MIYSESALLLVLLAVGGLCTYKDIKEGLIPNHYLQVGFISGIIAHAVLLFGFDLSSVYFTWIINMIFANIFAFVLFFNKLWAAGDAKLFMLMFFLIPPPILDGFSLSYCVIPYIYIFFVAFMWCAIDTIMQMIHKAPPKITPVKAENAICRFCIVFIETTAAYSLVSYAAREFVVENELFISALLLIYAYFCGTNDYMKKRFVWGIHAVILSVLLLLKGLAFSIPDWKYCVFLALVFCIQHLSTLYNYQLLLTNNVKKGMILSAETILLFQQSRVHQLPVDASEELSARISEEEANAVRRWGKTEKGQSYVWIVRKIPFAIMIYSGFLAWIIIRLVR